MKAKKKYLIINDQFDPVPCGNIKPFTKGHSFPSPHGLWGHLGAIWVSKHQHPMSKHIPGSCGAFVDVIKSCQRPNPSAAGRSQEGQESPEDCSSSPLCTSFLTPALGKPSWFTSHF